MKNLLIFGTGKNADKVCKNTDINFYKIIAYIDNDINKQGTLKNGINIISPMEINTMPYDLILICSTFFDEIMEQLLKEFNINPKLIFWGETFFLENKKYNIGSMTLNNNPDNKFYDFQDLVNNINIESMNSLEKYFFYASEGNLTKWLHYFDIYNRHFSKFIDKEVTIVEIGVYKGGSLKMWKKYFGDKCKIYGIDIDPNCEKYAEDQVEILIGSQEDRKFLKDVREKINKIDILIDDGGHTMNQQIVSFEELFDSISDDGVYLCEDLHTSYWEEYVGGYKRNNTFIEYSKNFIDYINAWHSREKELNINKYTETMHSLHFYDSVLVIEKNRMLPSISFMTLSRKK